MRNNSKKKILIVEDEALLAEMYQGVFEQEGFDTLAAGNGQDALDIAEREKPNFILLDILLPGDNGIYFLQQRQQNTAIKDIPVIAFSNLDDPHMKEKAFELGAKGYLIKTDYTPHKLVAKVKHYIK